MNLFDIRIPSYGLLIAMGVITANLLAMVLLKRLRMDGNDFLVLEAYTFLGAFIGAKLLYLLVSFSIIDWSRFFEPAYFNSLMQGGFVFYGGLIGGLLFFFLAGKLHHISTTPYIRNLIWLIPYIHCFGRIGCHLAGCCYGRPYHGLFAVTYKKGTFAPANTSLFPVQIVEAIGLMVIACSIAVFVIRRKTAYTVEAYLISYSCLRFVLEFFRDDEVRGKALCFSTSQWISIGIMVATIGCLVKRKKWRVCR